MTAFADLHQRGKPLVLPNAWDFASAAALARAGFDAIGTTSLGVAAAAGLPDGLGATRTQTVALARQLGSLPCMVTVDIEGGFSEDLAAVVQLAREIADTGAVGINLEDGRRNSHLATMKTQVRLVEAIKEAVPELFVNARTDTHWLSAEVPDLAEALARVKAYEAAGADGIFVPGLADRDDIRAVVAAVKCPVNVLFLPNKLTVTQLADLGVARISCGSLLFRASLQAAVQTALAVSRGDPTPPDLPSYAEVNRMATDGNAP